MKFINHSVKYIKFHGADGAGKTWGHSPRGLFLQSTPWCQPRGWWTLASRTPGGTSQCKAQVHLGRPVPTCLALSLLTLTTVFSGRWRCMEVLLFSPGSRRLVISHCLPFSSGDHSVFLSTPDALCPPKWHSPTEDFQSGRWPVGRGACKRATQCFRPFKMRKTLTPRDSTLTAAPRPSAPRYLTPRVSWLLLCLWQS